MRGCYWCGSMAENKSAKDSKRYVLAVGDRVIFTDLTEQEYFYEYEGLVERGISPSEIAAYQQLYVRKVERYEFSEE